MKRVYLDNAATTLVDPRVLDVATEFADMLRSTSLSTSDVTRAQRASLVDAREAVARFLNCTPREIALMRKQAE